MHTLYCVISFSRYRHLCPPVDREVPVDIQRSSVDREEYVYARTAARSPYVGSDYHSSCERGSAWNWCAVDLREKVWTVWMVFGMVCCSLFVVLQERHGICMVYGGCAACAALVRVTFWTSSEEILYRGLLTPWDFNNLAIIYLHQPSYKQSSLF